MHRSALTLAALSTTAVVGMDVHTARPLDAAEEGFDSALLTDGDHRRWVVRSPRTAAAGAALEAEMALVQSFAPFVDDGALEFAVPRPAGFAALPEGGRAVVYPWLPGRPLDPARLRSGPGLAAAIGRALGSLHELPTSLVENLGLPTYAATEYRDRLLAEVDEAARTGRVPARLLRRWESQLENVAVWRFQPTVVHGDLDGTSLLVDRDEVSAVVRWSQCRVADPADDLSWLLAAAPEPAVESIVEAYQLRRTELRDPHLVERALLGSEIALARWLLHGVRSEVPEIVDDAVEMLLDLDDATADPVDQVTD
ncbi:MAG: phosphotransferase [Cellulomonadaceae bacterium]